jgi:hypothetical protein
MSDPAIPPTAIVPGFQPVHYASVSHCWATAVAMVERVLFPSQPFPPGLQHAQEIAAAHLGRPIAPGPNGVPFGQDPADMITADELRRLLRRRGITVRKKNGAITESSLRTEIANGRPVIIGHSWLDREHVKVAYRYETLDGLGTLYHVCDPTMVPDQVYPSYERLRDPQAHTRWSTTFHRLGV